MPISLTDSLMKTVVSKMTSSFIPSGSVFCRFAERRAHRVGDADGVRAGLLEDAHRLDGLAVGRARTLRDVLEAVLHERDVRRGAPATMPPAPDTTMLRSVCRSAASPRKRTSKRQAAVVELTAGHRDVLLL